MKALLTVLCFVAGQVALAAGPACVEEIEFRSEPTGCDWLILHAARMSDGTIACALYSVPPPDADRTRRAARRLKKERDISLSREQFEALAQAIEGAGLRGEAEARDAIGRDGAVEVFTRVKAGRKVELRFWNPGEASEAEKLREEFYKIAGFRNALRMSARL